MVIQRTLDTLDPARTLNTKKASVTDVRLRGRAAILRITRMQANECTPLSVPDTDVMHPRQRPTLG